MKKKVVIGPNIPAGSMLFADLVADIARLAAVDVPAMRREAGKQGGIRPRTVADWARAIRLAPFSGEGHAEGRASTGREGEVLSVTLKIEVLEFGEKIAKKGSGK